jgi:hypothetical protein
MAVPPRDGNLDRKGEEGVIFDEKPTLLVSESTLRRRERIIVSRQKMKKCGRGRQRECGVPSSPSARGARDDRLRRAEGGEGGGGGGAPPTPPVPPNSSGGRCCRQGEFIRPLIRPFTPRSPGEKGRFP